MKTFYKILICSILTLITMSGCMNVNKLEVKSFRIGRVLPQGFKSINASASAVVNNQSIKFSIKDIKGTLYRMDRPLGTFDIAPITINARSEQEYTLNGSMALCQDVAALEIMSLISRFNIKEYYIDLSFTAKPGGGAAKKFKFERIPAYQIIKMLK